MRKTLLLLGLCSGLFGAPSKSSELVARIADDYWQEMLKDPLLRSREGLEVSSLPDVSYRKAAAHAEQARKMLDRLQAVNPSEIDHDEQIMFHSNLVALQR